MSEIRLTQLATAEQLVRELDGSARFNQSRQIWMIWDGSRFVPDEKGSVELTAKFVAGEQWKVVAEPPPGTNHKLAYMHAVKSESASGIAAVMRLAQTEPGISIIASDLDADQYSLNVQNGVVDLHTGKLFPAEKDLLLSKLAPVKFDPAARCMRWLQFLDRIMDSDSEMIDYLQRVAGLCLSGDASMQELYILHGGGANGKSVFIDTLISMMGDYAGTAPDSLLTQKAHGEHPTEIADLCGKRLVAASETEDGAKLRVQLVKRLTGDQWIKGRFMRCDYFSFRRTYKLLLATNNRPRINETTNAIWRRVRLIPFNVTIPADERDTQLLGKLQAEWPGILNWCIAGFLDFKAHGMQTPQAVQIATDDYQAEQDPLHEYLSDRCIVAAGMEVSRNDVYADYASWCRTAGDQVPDRNSFYERLRRISGVDEARKRMNGPITRVFTGIGLADLGNQYRHSQGNLSGME